MTRNRIACVAIVSLLLAGAAHAQQTTVYGPDGRVTGRSTTDSQGSTTFYGADGRVSGRTSTDSQGTTVLYGSDGRRVGTVTTTKPHKGK